MIVKKVFQGFLLSLISLGWLGVRMVSAAPAASFSADTRLEAMIQLDPISPVTMGEPITVRGVIRDQNGQAIADKSIFFYLDGELLGQTPSNFQGVFERTFGKLLDARNHLIIATSKESRLLTETSASIFFTVLPAQVIVKTIPPIQGVPFRMDGRRFFSDQEGFAKIDISYPGEYQLQVLAEEYTNPNQRVEFSRWKEESFEPSLKIQVPAREIIQVGLNVYHLLGLSFTDLDGFPVDPERISEINIRSLQGDVLNWADGQPRWIPASRVARRLGGLEETKLYYSVSSVMIDGSNVVNQSQQRFYSSPGGTWTISLILYTLKVGARDGLVGSPVGKALELEFPDGRVESYALDSSGQVTLHSMARGTYYLKINGVKGVKNRIPVSLSKNQEVLIRIITAFDLVFFGTIGVIFALSLLAIGRPWLLYAAIRRSAHLEVVKPLAAEKRPIVGKSQIDPIRNTNGETPADLLQSNDTGVSVDTFELMLRMLEGSLPKGGKPSKLSLKDQLIITLLHIQKNASIAELSQRYHVSESTVRRMIQKISPILYGAEQLTHTENPNLISTKLSGNRSDIRDSVVEGGIL